MAFVRRLKKWNPALSATDAAAISGLHLSNIRKIPSFVKRKRRGITERTVLQTELSAAWRQTEEESGREYARRLKLQNPQLSIKSAALLSGLKVATIRNIPEFLTPTKAMQATIAAVSPRQHNETARAFVRRLKEEIPDLSVNDAAFASGLPPSTIYALPHFLPFSEPNQDAVRAVSPRRPDETTYAYLRRLKQRIPGLSVNDAAIACGLSPSTIRGRPEFISASEEIQKAVAAVSPRTVDETKRDYLRRLKQQNPELSIAAAAAASGLTISHVRRLPEFFSVSPAAQDAVAQLSPRQDNESARDYLRRLKAYFPALSVQEAATISGLPMIDIRCMPEFFTKFRSRHHATARARRKADISSLPGTCPSHREEKAGDVERSIATPPVPEADTMPSEPVTLSHNPARQAPDAEAIDDAIHTAARFFASGLPVSPLPDIDSHASTDAFSPLLTDTDARVDSVSSFAGAVSPALPDDCVDSSDKAYRYKAMLYCCLDDMQQALRQAQAAHTPDPDGQQLLTDCFDALFLQGLGVRLADMHNGFWTMPVQELQQRIKDTITDYIRVELADNTGSKNLLETMLNDNSGGRKNPMLTQAEQFADRLEQLNEMPDARLPEKAKMPPDLFFPQDAGDVFFPTGPQAPEAPHVEEVPAVSDGIGYLPPASAPMTLPNPDNQLTSSNAVFAYTVAPAAPVVPEQYIEMHLQKGALSATVKWPISDRDACASWLRELMQ